MKARGFLLALCCGGLLACSSRDAPSTGEAPPTAAEAGAAPSASVSAAAAPSAAAPAEPPTLRYSIASFIDDELAECVDFSLVNAPAGTTAEKMAKGLEGAQLLKRSCAETFPDRAPLARCRAEKSQVGDAGPPLTMVVASTMFRFQDVFDSDSFMRDCLKASGDWKAVARDSPEATEARRKLSRRAAEKVLETAR